MFFGPKLTHDYRPCVSCSGSTRIGVNVNSFGGTVKYRWVQIFEDRVGTRFDMWQVLCIHLPKMNISCYICYPIRLNVYLSCNYYFKFNGVKNTITLKNEFIENSFILAELGKARSKLVRNLLSNSLNGHVRCYLHLELTQTFQPILPSFTGHWTQYNWKIFSTHKRDLSSQQIVSLHGILTEVTLLVSGIFFTKKKCLRVNNKTPLSKKLLENY